MCAYLMSHFRKETHYLRVNQLVVRLGGSRAEIINYTRYSAYISEEESFCMEIHKYFPSRQAISDRSIGQKLRHTLDNATFYGLHNK